ncbi:hypothetical protein [Kitasatospora sp. NPDC006786]|uniref:hypothetical protein n=1 Tax=unclassified Kitasatospora TaxID=2633591 RepID=UPI0033DFE9BD
MLGAGAVVAVHVDGRTPLVPALYLDGLLAVGWLSLLALAVPRRRSAGPSVDDGGGPPQQADLPHRTDAEPRATSHWRGRHGP